MESIGDILQKRIEAFNKDPVLAIKTVGKQYREKWKKGVEFFYKRINEDRKRDNLPPVDYMAVRQKLIAIKEIDDLRWFYNVCDKYSKTKDKQGNQNSFSKCFWGVLRT